MMTSGEKEILEHLIREISEIKAKIPNGEIALLIKSLNDVKEDLSELKYILLNPENGVIVKTNKNTEFRIQETDKKVSDTELYFRLREEVKDLKEWKSIVSKFLWILLMAVLGLGANVISGILGN